MRKTREIKLVPDGGIPAHLLLLMAIVSGFTVANLYYSQPLLEDIRTVFGVSDVTANFITVITQTGYALGLLFIVPMADMYPRRKIVAASMLTAMAMALAIASAPAISVILAVSLLLGMSSVIPQIFIPIAGLYSPPEHKARNMGYVSSGLLTGILSARVISGYIGDWLGWRAMFCIAAALMVICLVLTLRSLPDMKPTFYGRYPDLMKSVWDIFRTHPRMRMYSLRAACSFGCMMSIWSCMAFYLAGSPFYAGSDKVGLLGLCGAVGAVAAGGIGKFVPRFGALKMSFAGALLQIAAWATAFFLGTSYFGLIAAIIMLDLGAQCQQLSNQAACLGSVPDGASRANTIFMTSLFLGGGAGTFISGMAWNHLGWAGVCLTGTAFACASVCISLYEQMHNGRPSSISPDKQ